MLRVIPFLILLLLIPTCLQASPVAAEASAEIYRLQDQVDAREHEFAAMEAYAGRLQRLLSREGVSTAEYGRDLPLAQKLRRRLPRVHSDHTPLINALAGLGRITNVELKVDWKAFVGDGVGPRSPVTCELENPSVERAIHEILTAAGRDDIVLLPDKNAATVTTANEAAKHVVTKEFDLTALFPDDRNTVERRNQLYHVVTDIAPESWKDAGGVIGRMGFRGDTMIITQTPENLAAVEVLLEDLDVARQFDHLRARIDRQEFEMFARRVQIEKLSACCRSLRISVPPPLDKALAEVVADANFVGTPLSACFQSLRGASGQVIDVNWKELQRKGISDDMPITLTLRRQTLAGALRDLLDKACKGAGTLEYAADGNIITVSTKDSFDGDAITRTYDVRDLLTGHHTRAEAVDQWTKFITTTIATDSWRDNGGTTGALREFQGILIITQTAKAHERIRDLLQQCRDRRKFNGGRGR